MGQGGGAGGGGSLAPQGAMLCRTSDLATPMALRIRRRFGYLLSFGLPLFGGEAPLLVGASGDRPAMGDAEDAGHLLVGPCCGFVSLQPSSGKFLRGQPPSLRHSLTGEVVALGGAFLERAGVELVPESYFRLEVSGKVMQLRYGGRVLGEVNNLLASPVRVHSSGKWCWPGASGLKFFDRNTWDAKPCYWSVSSRSQSHMVKTWTLELYSRGCRHWFCVEDIWAVQPVWKTVAASQGAQSLFQMLTRAASKVSLSVDLLFKRTVRTGGAGCPERCIEANTLSTTGLVFLSALLAIPREKHTDEESGVSAPS